SVEAGPEPVAKPAPYAGPAHRYRPLPAALPRFWTPYFLSTGAAGEIRYGATTGGSDPLGRHYWGLDVYRGSESKLVGGSGFYVYDRFRPQLLVALDNSVESRRSEATRQREALVSVSVPLARSRRWGHDLSLGW